MLKIKQRIENKMEIDILKAKKVFKQYVEKYNPEDEKIKIKICNIILKKTSKFTLPQKGGRLRAAIFYMAAKCKIICYIKMMCI